jgi:hypothetical protein
VFEALLLNTMKIIINSLLIFASIFLFFSCSDESEKSDPVPYVDVATNPEKDAAIQRYNIDLRKERSERFPCDTISVIEYFFENYPPGTYLLETDRTSLKTLPKPAIIYFTDKDGSNYIFTLIATSRQGERLIETKNLVGYNESYIDLDSTKLGTPFLYLVLLECKEDKIFPVWESIVPSHGGFNNFSVKTWGINNTIYLENLFYFAQGIGMIKYNYFLIDGIRSEPHLLMTYDGIDFKRTISNINDDKYPDYYEYVFVSLEDRIYARDSVAFIWDINSNLYVNTRNSRQTRLY